ncbi:hypothetical protein Bca4012_092914 [Brassica carinata]|uniref:Uncharacterized protein n=1 Tax=Brassica carinata TaxID=52824 RepID=A0A8X7PP26_BRACI|nr:hypothetical protein Bca52824_075183 [Brassica carinata]
MQEYPAASSSGTAAERDFVPESLSQGRSPHTTHQSMPPPPAYVPPVSYMPPPHHHPQPQPPQEDVAPSPADAPAPDHQSSHTSLKHIRTGLLHRTTFGGPGSNVLR